MRPIVTLLVLLLSVTAASAAEVYKWKDKDGRVHYGDKPKDQPADSVIIESSSGSGTPSAAAAEGASRDTECSAKKARLESYRRAPSISEIDNLGKTREYSAAERQQYLDQEQQRVDAACAPRAPSPAAAGTFPPPEAPVEEVKAPPEEKPAPTP
ncbi:MAG: DUF4124 domain-containing protein [Gammaproteobacteria bacterium]